MRKIICYFETEAQCEAAVTALQSAQIDTNSVRIVSDSTKNSDTTTPSSYKRIGSSAPFALPEDYANNDSSAEANYAQAPVATLLIRGDLFTFHDDNDTPCGSYAVEVTGDKDTLEAARDILLNLF